VDDFKIEPHPRNAAGSKTRFCAYEDYTTDLPPPKQPAPAATSRPKPKTTNPPWFPFKTRKDFEFAELMQDAGVNTKQLDAIVLLINKIVKNPEEFTFQDGQHVSDTWKAATTAHGHGLKEVEVEAEYDGEIIKFPVWRMDTEKWMLDILYSPALRSKLRFDAERLFQHDGEKFVRFYNEPWTANRWWKVQDLLPANGAPFAIIFYADKTKLSSMGTKKGYPVYVCCANLPAHIRHSEEFRGRIMVGWLPIVPEDSDKSGKKFVDFKRIIWHAAVTKIFEALKKWAESGLFYIDAWGIERLLFPIIFIISSDFEEQCVIAAIRGMGADFPCPVCLIPKDELPGLGKAFPVRTTVEMREVYQRAQSADTLAERNTILQAVGLWDVENTFWSFGHTDVYSAPGWDRLHAYHGGLFRKHILQELLSMIEKDRGSTSLIEAQLDETPRWRDLSHFSHISQFNEFSDGRKYEDLSKATVLHYQVLIFATHNLYDPGEMRGYRWLLLLRSYMELDLWTSLIDHSEVTLQLGREELLRFEAVRQDYVEVHPEKKWDFPKAHSHAHVFDDIEDKGVTLNYNTKGFEKMHGDAKTYYNRSNFRDLEKLLARFSHEHLAASMIRTEIDRYDEATALAAQAEELPQAGEVEWVSTGSPVKGVPLSGLATHAIEDYAGVFTNLRSKLARRLAYDLGLRNPVSIPANQTVTAYKYIKANYISLEDSHIATDFLRVNQDFFNRPCYDCALISVGDDAFMIGRIISVFDILLETEGKSFSYKLVIPMDKALRRDAKSRTNQSRCEELRLKQLRSRDLKDSVLVPVASIVRGALVVRDWGIPDGCDDQYIVMDGVDADFFLRMRLQGLGDRLVTRTNREIFV
ncbi:hypothetical protein FA13DRAFT_1629677, partial [Coprinellus micaceus]